MPRPKRAQHATAAETTSPPPQLPGSQTIARIIQAAGNNLYLVHLPTIPLKLPRSEERRDVELSVASGTTTLVEMPTRFRGVIWVKKGSYVVVDLTALLLGVAAGEDQAVKRKVGGEIVNVVREEKRWRGMEYWPEEFGVTVPTALDSDSESDSDEEEESTVGKMPP